MLVRNRAEHAHFPDLRGLVGGRTPAAARLGLAAAGRHVAPSAPHETDAGDDQPRIVADPQGTLVGWIGEDRPGSLTFETYDQAAGERWSRTAPPEARSSVDVVFHAIDGRTGYWRTPSGTYAVDLDIGVEHPLVTSADGQGFEIHSVENGVLSFRRNDSVLAGRSIGEARELLRYGQERLTMVILPGRLSPTGAWLGLAVVQLEKVAEGDFRGIRETAEVFSTSSGERFTLDITLDAPGNQALAIPIVWLDDVTLQVATLVTDRPFGSQPATSVDAALYTCTVPDRACRPAANLGRIETANPAGAPVMPDGRWGGI